MGPQKEDGEDDLAAYLEDPRQWRHAWQLKKLHGSLASRALQDSPRGGNWFPKFRPSKKVAHLFQKMVESRNHFFHTRNTI